VKCLTCSCTSCDSPSRATGMSNVNWVSQSDEATEKIEETVGFADQTPGKHYGMPAAPDALSKEDVIDVASLQQFLKRPVRIANITWSQSDATGSFLSDIFPWQAFFTDARVQYKLHNFAFIRCNLKLKILVNASQFYYGKVAACYQPLWNDVPSTITDSTPAQYLIPYSQRPTAWLNAGESEGAEMTLPFFYPTTFMPATSSTSFQQMGKLRFLNYTPLRSANGAVGQGVTIQVYAWAEDVELQGYTMALAAQSNEVLEYADDRVDVASSQVIDTLPTKKDEYGEGIISRPASVVAAVAALLKGLPVIGPYATATEIGASAIAGVAQIFGYTNTPVLDDTKPLRPSAFPQMASTELGFPVEKLSVDPKNELAIGSCASGVPMEDELTIAAFTRRQSYWYSFTWATTDATDTKLTSFSITPDIFVANGASGNNVQIDSTPLGHLARLFTYWRGDIIYTFDIVASKYHKGRLRFTWEPFTASGNNVTTNSTNTNTVINKIVDIGETSRFEVRIPYQARAAYLRTLATAGGVDYRNSTLMPTASQGNETYTNGAMAVRVANTLSAPVAVAPVTVLVSVRAADNFEYANPIQLKPNETLFVPQSAEKEEKASFEVDDEHGIDPRRLRIYQGETLHSLRPLLHRPTYVSSTVSTTAITGMQWLTATRGLLPPVYGYDPTGLDLASKVIGTGQSNFNYTPSKVVDWIGACFVAYRGSCVWTVNSNSITPTSEVSIERNNTNTGTIGDLMESTIISNYNTMRRNLMTRKNTAAGRALTTGFVNSGLSALVPMQSRFKFMYNTLSAGTTSAAADDKGLNLVTIKMRQPAAPGGETMDLYWNAGPDFTFNFFLNVPSVATLTAIPAAI